ncbi:MAG: 3-deoxy-8-phosphooctulonate synthase [Elusimicrobia bacterium]|nr:3-deoxy-8-phosphooctulonate synthase [Elusimicrobiota bacterium]MBD3411619.1 3-deoxy-8-phosphooctulonate synthase [Elusimicrobiota bacterium]
MIMKKISYIRIDKYRIGNDLPFTMIAGPCVIDGKRTPFAIARFLKNIAHEYGIGIIYKASYDKANRTSIQSYRGVGIDTGLRILESIKKTFDLPVMTDIHAPGEARSAAEVCDMIQIPAFLSRQTDLLVSAGKTGKPVNIKKGQFMAPEDMVHAAAKVRSTGNAQILVTERGFCFGYHNLVSDMRSLDIMKRHGLTVVFDATHSVQLPGGSGSQSAGQVDFVEPLARAATAVGIAGIFVEIHPRPAHARSDGANSLNFKQMENLVQLLQRIDRSIKPKGKTS